MTVPGLIWSESGTSALTGPLFERFQALDEMFLRFADHWNATKASFPPLISARELAKIGYFESFPHLFTAAVTLAADEANLRDFVKGGMIDDGALKLSSLSPVKEILAPAAC